MPYVFNVFTGNFDQVVDVDDTPIDGATKDAISSNWAFDTDTKLTPLIDDSMADTLHRHSELSASDGIPDRALVVDALGNVGIGTTTPTAVLHLKAGTATAGTAPLKLTSGINLTTPEAGVIEFDGTDLFITI